MRGSKYTQHEDVMNFKWLFLYFTPPTVTTINGVYPKEAVMIGVRGMYEIMLVIINPFFRNHVRL